MIIFSKQTEKAVNTNFAFSRDTPESSFNGAVMALTLAMLLGWTDADTQELLTLLQGIRLTPESSQWKEREHPFQEESTNQLCSENQGRPETLEPAKQSGCQRPECPFWRKAQVWLVVLKKKILIYLYFLCNRCFAWTCICANVYAVPMEASQKRASGQLALQTVVSFYIGAGDWTWVLRRNHHCS